MPQRRSGIKDLRKNKRNRLHNLDIKTDLKKTIKSLRTSAASDNKADAESKLKEAYKKIDKAEKLHLIHKNTAARRKSHLAKLCNK
ncbi:MAG: 30S ribosomal protein S20 [Candidatus Omnitrophota bacterium]